MTNSLVPFMCFGAVVVIAIPSIAFLRRGSNASRRVPPGPEGQHQFDGSAARYRGGARVGAYSVSWPFAELTIDRSHASVRGLGFDDVLVARSEVREIDIRRASLGVEIAFIGAERLEHVRFWLVRKGSVSEDLSALGWPAI
jgi:hypothetical protein